MNIGDYAKAGQVYTGMTTAATATTGLSTTYTGLLIWNPILSPVVLLMYDAVASMSIVPSQAEVMISQSTAVSSTAPTGTTQAGLIQAAKTGGGQGASKAQLWTGTTLPSINVNVRAVPGSWVTAGVFSPGFYAKIDGSIIVVPGTGVMFSFTTNAYTAQMSFTWAEVPATSVV
jgi:hypothetical protein